MSPTVYHVLRYDGSRETRRVDWPEFPGYLLIKSLIEPIVGGRLEHVTVLYENRRADMFVNEYGHRFIPPLPRNWAATAIYRTNWLEQHASCEPEELPTIAGTAVLFERIIWG